MNFLFIKNVVIMILTVIKKTAPYEKKKQHNFPGEKEQLPSLLLHIF